MVKKPAEQKIAVTENLRGGEGSTSIQSMLDQQEMYDKGRLFGRILLKPGCSIGYHVHENEMEAYTVIRGTALYDDNGIKTELEPGDTTYTPCGQGHSVLNNGTEDLEIIALILFK